MTRRGDGQQRRAPARPATGSGALRVLLVNDFPADHPAAGGCEGVVEDTLRLLRARGIEAGLFTIDDVPGHARTPLAYISARRCREALADRLRRFRPHVVHLHNFYHVLSPAVLDAGAIGPGPAPRVVMTAHDFHLACPSPALCRVRSGRWIPVEPSRPGHLGYLLRQRWDERGRAHSFLRLVQHLWNYRVRHRRRAIDLVACPSRTMRQALAPLGLPTMLLPAPVPPPEAGGPRPPGPLRLVFAGRVAPEKGLAPFLEMVPTDLDWRLLVVGDGEALTACRRVVERRGLAARVEFAGHRSGAETLELIARSHVLVLPSIWPENAPRSMFEALARGTNLLVSRLGGMQEIVEDAGVGYTFRPGDGADLAGALGRLHDAARAGTLNVFDVRDFLAERSADRYVERLMSLYSQAGREGECRCAS